MHRQTDVALPLEEPDTLRKIATERMHRLTVLLDLDQALSRAANHYSLAADLVKRGGQD